ncbi:hypothetical protein ABZV77_22980 [Streptomyces sp. NPDC004732]|uniref:protein kinase domain-containing protein n=1 Tax=Streptomyces sp. NPDC004732 TaxID=3154290 RepID=UPI0033BCBB61
MATEALSADVYDYRSDLYSLGCVLFEAVTGRPPFTGTSWHLIDQHLKELNHQPFCVPCALMLL